MSGILRYIELFGGIGALTQAIKKIEIDAKLIDYVEIDKYAVASFNQINGTNFEVQDIKTWNKDFKNIDLIMHGSPCQDFSLAGKQAGGDKDSGTRSSLLYETLRIAEKLKPKYVIWENVKNILSKKHIHNFNAYLQALEELGYKNYYQVLNAKDYGIPQNRERVFTVSIRKDVDKGVFIFPENQPLEKKLKDFLEQNVDEKYYLTEEKIERISHWKAYQKPFKKVSGAYARTFGSRGKIQEKEICDTLTASMGTGGGNVPILKIKNATNKGYLEATPGDGIDISSRMQYHRGNVQKETIQTIDCTGGEGHGVVTNDLRIRKLTPKECWRLMGFDDSDYEKAKKVNSNTQLYKQAGNSIVVNVLEEIMRSLMKNE